jgi:hypothetical protein
MNRGSMGKRLNSKQLSVLLIHRSGQWYILREKKEVRVKWT